MTKFAKFWLVVAVVAAVCVFVVWCLKLTHPEAAIGWGHVLAPVWAVPSISVAAVLSWWILEWILDCLMPSRREDALARTLNRYL